VSRIHIDGERLPEKDLFALPRLHMMTYEDLQCVSGVPLESGRPGKQGVDTLLIVAHENSIYRVYTSVKRELREEALRGGG